MKRGIIIKGIGGFYYVKNENNIYECKARGRFRNKKITPLVGDYVKFSIDPLTEKGSIEEILDRKVELIRPPVANVDQAIIVIAAKNPQPNLQLLDKLLLLGELSELKLNICINKIDLDNEGLLENILDIYKKTNYNIIPTSTKKGKGIEEIKKILEDKITVFAGASGVGKSSILNSIQSGLELNTGEISKKIKRGKHTTRHSELLELELGGWVVDTPGFTSLNISFVDIEILDRLFPEFIDHITQCKFSNCIHIDEPQCGIKSAVKERYISESRYNNYIYFAKEIINNRNRRY